MKVEKDFLIDVGGGKSASGRSGRPFQTVKLEVTSLVFSTNLHCDCEHKRVVCNTVKDFT